MIHAIETLVRRMLKPAVVRCRIRASGMAIELDPPSLKALSPAAEDDLRSRIADLAGDMSGRTLAFAPYRAGSAFLAAAR
jgi:uncharacterized protein